MPNATDSGNWLKQIREEPGRRMRVRRDRSKGAGPFTFETRKEILERLLKMEKKMGIQLISDEEIACIHETWTQEIDFQDTALEIAAQYDREVSEMKQSFRTSEEDQLLDNLLPNYEELQPELIRCLLDLVKERLPSLNTYGAKKQLTREIKAMIEKSVFQKETAEQ